ncbi:MAG: hypothetical protein JWO36_2366 [Myxococcales bacterium]|nr:hypothetical protein [Myxococcales bacterium]
MKTSVAMFLSLSLAACYGSAPPRPPRVPLPDLQAGAEIDVFSESKTTYEPVQKQSSTCPAGKSEGDPSCLVTKYEVTEPVTRTTSRASYAASPITYGQLKVMTDPHYDEKLATLEDLSHKCQRANTPRYVGIGMFALGLIGGPIAARADATVGGITMYGGLIGGAVAYSLGYFAFGGRDCNRARSLSNEVDMTAAMTWDSVNGADYATEMQTLAQQFNATHRNGPSARVERIEPEHTHNESTAARTETPKRKLRMRR